MAFSSKYHVIQKTPNGPTYRIELLEDGFVGSSTEKVALGEVFTLEYESKEPKTVFSNPLQKSTLTLYLAIEDSSDLTILENIFGANEDQYRLRLKIDGSTYWEGAVLADLLEYSEGDYPFPGKIVAKDLSRLKGQTYSLTTGRDDIITVIADILSGLGLGLGIKTATSWTEKNISDSNDFLDEISLDKSRIRKFATADGESDQPYNKLEVLEMLCKNFGLILRQQDGYWWITQITEQANDPVTVFEYNSAGTFQSSSSVDLDAPVNKVDRWLQPQGQNKNYVGIQEAQVTFRHNTKEQVLHLPDKITLTTSNSSIDPIDFISDGTQTIDFSCNVRATESGDAAEVNAFIEFRIGSSGNYYYLTRDDNGDLQWDPNQGDLVIELNDFSGGPGFPGIDDETIDTDGVWEKRFGVDFETPTTPSDADGTYRITFKPAQDVTGTPAVVDETIYYNIQQEIVNPTISENNKAVHYTRTQAGTGFSETFDFGDTWFGDGPAVYSKSALTWFDGVENVATVSEWRRTGGTAELALQVLLLRELLDIQRNHIEGKRAALLGDYKTQQILTTDSGNTRYFFLSGQLSGKRSEWDAYFFRINIDTAGDDTIGTFYDDPDDDGTGGGGGGGNPPPTGPVGKLTESISGSRTSIKIEAFTKIESGKDYYIYNAAKRKNISITPTETVDVGNHTIAIQSQTIIAPEGSYIVKEPGQDETDKTIFDSRITENDSEISANVAAISDNSTANSNLTLLVDEQSQSNAIGTISAQVSGTTTSISLENTPFEVKLDDGDELTILSNDKDDQGNRESFTVNGNQTLTAGTNTLSINSKSFSNTYPVGSYVYETQAALTARATISARLATTNESAVSSLSLVVSEGREAQAIGLTSAQVSGSTSSIGLTDVPFEIKVDDGDTLRILSLADSDEGASEEFTVDGAQTLTAGTDTVSIVTKSFSNTYPTGSSVFEPASSLTARATLATRLSTDNESAVSSLSLVVSEGRAVKSIGLTSAEVSGSTTSIGLTDVPFEIKIDDGDTLHILSLNDSDEGAAEEFTVNGNQTLTAGTDSINIVSKTFSNTYPVGSSVYEPVSSLTARATLAVRTSTTNSSSISSLDLRVTDNEATAVLKAEVTSGGITKLAFVELQASVASGSAINMSADLIQINGVVFDDGAGLMKSSDFDASTKTGWRLTGGSNSKIEIGNAIIWGGSIEGIDLQGNVGSIRVEDTLPASGNYDGEILYLTSEPNSLYKWNASTSTWNSTVDGDDLLVNSVTAGKISVAKLSAITASMGALTIDDKLEMSGSGEITNSTTDYTIDDDGFWIPASGVLDASAYKMGNTASSPTAYMRFDDSTPDEPFVELKFSTVGRISIKETQTTNTIDFETADLAVFNMPVQATSATNSNELITRGGGDGRYVRWSSVASGTSIVEDSIITITAPSGTEYKVLAEKVI